MNLPRSMRVPRKVWRTSGTDSWHYVNPDSIDVLIRIEGFGAYSAQLTKAKLKRALKIMESRK